MWRLARKNTAARIEQHIVFRRIIPPKKSWRALFLQLVLWFRKINFSPIIIIEVGQERERSFRAEEQKSLNGKEEELWDLLSYRMGTTLCCCCCSTQLSLNKTAKFWLFFFPWLRCNNEGKWAYGYDYGWRIAELSRGNSKRQINGVYGLRWERFFVLRLLFSPFRLPLTNILEFWLDLVPSSNG